MKQERHELQFPKMPRNTEEDWLTSGLVDGKLSAELADVEANPLGEVSLSGMSDARKKRVKQLAFMKQSALFFKTFLTFSKLFTLFTFY